MSNMSGLRFDTAKIDIFSILKNMSDINTEAVASTLIKQSELAETKMTPEEFDSITVNDEDISDYLTPYTPAFENLVRHCKYGAEVKGYGKHNWLGGMKWSRMVNSLLRHLFLFVICGITRDKESGSKHTTAIVWNALGLAMYEEKGLGENDIYG